MQPPSKPTFRPIRQSLIRKPRFAGVSKSFLVMEACLTGAVVVGLGFQVAALLTAGVVLFGLHPVMVWVSKTDFLMPALLVRHLLSQDYYPPQARRQAPPGRPFRALPHR